MEFAQFISSRWISLLVCGDLIFEDDTTFDSCDRESRQICLSSFSSFSPKKPSNED